MAEKQVSLLENPADEEHYGRADSTGQPRQLPTVIDAMEPSCGNCRKKYRLLRGGGGGGRRDNSLIPLLLSCGHNFCSSCLERMAKMKVSVLVCPTCQEQTVFSPAIPIVGQLTPCYTVLGMVAAREFRLMSPILSLVTPTLTERKDGMFGNKPFVSSLSRSHPKCEECDNTAAAVRCSTCGNLYCNPCFKQIHASSRTLRQHVPILVEEEMAKCVSHPSSSATGYCYQCCELLCAVCREGHSEHEIGSVDEAIIRLKQQIQPFYSSAQVVLDKLVQAEEDLVLHSSELNEMSVKYYHEIHSFFIEVAAALQIREQLLLGELSKAHEVHCDNLASMMERVRKGMEVLMERLDQWSGDNITLLKNYPTLVESLSGLESFPCKLRQEKASNQMRVSLDQQLVKLVKDTCSVDIGHPQFCLVGGDEEEEQDEEDISLISSDTDHSIVSPTKYSSSHDTSLLSVSRVSERRVPVIRGTKNRRRIRSGGSSATTSRSVSPQVLESAVPVTVSHVESPSEFWVQTASVSELSTLQQILANHCQSATALNPADIVPGLHCVAIINDMWYRVEVENIQLATPSYVGVFRLDYGNSEIVTRSSLRGLPKLKKPLMSKKCRLAGIEPTSRSSNLAPQDWSHHALSLFRTYALNQPGLTMKVESVDHLTGISSVHLFLPDSGTSLADELLLRGQAQKLIAPTVTMPLPPPTLAVGDVVKVIVVCVEGPNDLYVQLLEDTTSDVIDSISKDIIDENAKPRLPNTTIKPGMLVCAFYSVDKMLYRAEVIESVDDGMVKVRYLDYGNTDVVDCTRVFQPKSKLLLNTPPQALHVSLSGILPVEGDCWPVESAHSLYTLVDGHTITMTVMGKGSPIPVMMSDSHHQDVAAILVAMDIARYAPKTPSNSPTPPNLSPPFIYASSSSARSSKKRRQKKSGTTRSSSSSSSSSSFPSSLDCFPPIKPPIKQTGKKQQGSGANAGNVSLPLSASSVSSIEGANQHKSDSPPRLNGEIPPPSPPQAPPLEEAMATIVTHASSPFNFHICTSSPKELQHLLENISLSSPSSGSSFTITPDTYCCARFYADGQFHRALVKEEVPEEDGSWEVLFVDYGNTEVVVSPDIIPLTNELAALPMVAFPCKLYGVEPADKDGWTHQACTTFSDMVLTKEVTVTLKAHPNLVSITIGDEDIGTLLCQSEYATPTNPTH